MSQFPSNNLSLTTVANALNRNPRNMNNLRGATVWDTNFNPLTVSSINNLNLSFFFNKYYTNPYIAPITYIYDPTTNETAVGIPLNTARLPISYKVTLIGDGGGGGGGGGGTYSVVNNASGGGGGGGSSGQMRQIEQIFLPDRPNRNPLIWRVGTPGYSGAGGNGSGSGDFGSIALTGANGGSGGSIFVSVLDINGNPNTVVAHGGSGGKGGGRAIYTGTNGTPGTGGAGGASVNFGSVAGLNGANGSNGGYYNNTGGAGGTGGMGYEINFFDGTGIFGSGGSGGKGGDTGSGFYGSGNNGEQGLLGAVIITWYYNGYLV